MLTPFIIGVCVLLVQILTYFCFPSWVVIDVDTLCCIQRRVHITRATLDHLGDRFEVESGGGAGREAYLADHKIETFLIVPPKVREKI